MRNTIIRNRTLVQDRIIRHRTCGIQLLETSQAEDNYYKQDTWNTILRNRTLQQDRIIRHRTCGIQLLKTGHSNKI